MSSTEELKPPMKELNLLVKHLKSAVKEAKHKWIQDQCNTLNLHHGTKMAWDDLN